MSPIDASGASSRPIQAPTDRDFSKLSGLSMAVVKAVAVIAPSAGNGHKDAASLTLARVPDQLASEFGGADANATPRLPASEARSMQVRPDRQEGSGRSSRRCFPFRQERPRPKVFMTPRIWLESSVVISDQPRACRDKRAGQHAVQSFHPNLTKEPDFCELRQTIGVVRVRLVRRHIEGRFSMARIDADRRQSLGAQRMIKPHRQWSGSRIPRVSRLAPACG